MSTVNVASEDRIGRYKVVRTIGLGNSSSVIEVTEEGTGRRFAIKQLMPGAAQDRDQRKALEFEANLGLELRHPNLIRIHEYVKDPVQPYYVMELFTSQNLRLALNPPRQTLNQARYEPLPRDRLHRILEQAAAALAYMHEKGWVHRDVKPENILVNKGCEVRVIDYGITRKIPSGLGRLLFRKPTHIEGTPSYLAPEQIRKEAPAPSADIYSFGVTCYELACGRKPLLANSKTELLRKHLHDRPSPPTVYEKSITPEFAELVMAMIQKCPSDRPASLRDFLSRFARVRIFQDDPDPQSGRDGF